MPLFLICDANQEGVSGCTRSGGSEYIARYLTAKHGVYNISLVSHYHGETYCTNAQLRACVLDHGVHYLRRAGHVLPMNKCCAISVPGVPRVDDGAG